MATFQLPTLHYNSDAWGPSDDCLPSKFKNLPYNPFNKKDCIGKVADWTGNFEQRNRWSNRWQPGMQATGNMFDVNAQDYDLTDFNLVNNAEDKKRGRQNWGYKNRGDNKLQHTQKFVNEKQNNTITRAKKPFTGNGRNNQRPGQFQRRNNRNREQKEVSLKAESSWKQVEHFQLPNLAKKSMKQPEGQDVFTCGQAKMYNKGYDTISSRNKIALKPDLAKNMDFSLPNTTKDTVLNKCMAKVSAKKVLIVGSDNQVSTVMCMSRSSIPWHLTVHKMTKGETTYMIFDNDQEQEDDNMTVEKFNPIDGLSVSETAQLDLPTEDNVEDFNKFKALVQECETINNTLSQQIHKPDPQNKLKSFKGNDRYQYANNSKPKNEDGTDSGSSSPETPPVQVVQPKRLIRFRKFPLDKEAQVELLVRTHVDAWEPPAKGQSLKRNGMPNFVNIHCLNEWNPRYASGVYWNKYLEKQTSTILATEIKNNNFKVAKWIMNDLMADVTNVKLAYVSRDNYNDPNAHSIVNMESYAPPTLAQTANLNIENAWAIFKTVVDTILNDNNNNGMYHIIRSPNKSEATVYREEPDEERDSSSEDDESGSGESGSESDDSDDESGSDSNSGSEEESEDEEDEEE